MGWLHPTAVVHGDAGRPGAGAGGGALALLAALGYRTGALELGTSFSFLRWGARAGLAALAVSLVGLVLTVVRGRRGPLDDLAPGVAAGRARARHRRGLLRHPGRATVNRTLRAAHPRHHDRHGEPAGVRRRPAAPGGCAQPAEYDPEIAPRQREGYPDLGPIILDEPRPRFSSVRWQPCTALGWELVGDDADAGPHRSDGHDVLVRFSRTTWSCASGRTAAASRVDVRSKSRVGGSDVGANAARIRTFAERLTGG